MKAIEFEATYKDGAIIVPDNLKNSFGSSSFRVIVLQQEKQLKTFDGKNLTPMIDTTGFKFDREEAHER
jgi:uncharacterized protein YcgL (UPF0745 family)